MRQLLLITYHFPPQGGAGVQRSLKFVKYLPEFGWHPIILTVKPVANNFLDPTLEADIPADVQIFRTPAFRLARQLPWRLRSFIARWILVVDDQLGWLPYATTTGEKIIDICKPDAIFSSSPPYTTHLIANRLASKWHLPWIADFRDPWIGNINLRLPTNIHTKIVVNFENKIITRADCVSVVTDPMRQNFLQRYPLHDPFKFLAIPNGYDPQEFESIENVGIDDGKFVITYTGSFYAEWRTPDNFLLSLKQLLEQQGICPEKLSVFFVGNIGKNVQRIISSLGLNKIVQIVGYLDHRKSIGYLNRSNLLLLIIGNGPGSESIMTGKVFEYLAAKKPILSLSPPGVASDLILEAQAGSVIDPDDVSGIARKIEFYYRRWENGINDYNPRLEVIERYDRRKLTAQLANTIDALLI